jgi:hypothetical protein
MKRPNSEVASAINPDSVLVMDESFDRNQAEVRSEEETSLLALIDGKRTVAEILQLSRMSGFVAMRRLRALLERRAIRPLARVMPGSPSSASAPHKGGRLGLTQDLTSAAETFAAHAKQTRREPTQTRPGMTPEARPPEPKPLAQPSPATVPIGARSKIEMPPPAAKEASGPAAARVTPLQGSVSLPSVIIAFGPDFLDGRKSPTRRLGSADLVVPPPQPAPRETVAAPRPQTLIAEPSQVVLSTPASAGALVSVSKTAMMPRATQRRARRRLPSSSAEIEAQELWLSVTRRDWQTLAVVAAHPDAAALSVASALAEAGTLLRGKAVELFVADGGDTNITGEWTWNGRASRPITLPTGGLPPTTDRFDRVVALESLSVNPRGITLAQSAEAVLLVAEEGVTDLRLAKRTMDMIGRERFVGCVLLSSAR